MPVGTEVVTTSLAVKAARTKRPGRQVTVTLPGGDLLIEWREHDDHVLMTGTAAACVQVSAGGFRATKAAGTTTRLQSPGANARTASPTNR